MLPPKMVDVVFSLYVIYHGKKVENRNNQQNNPRKCLYKPPGEVSFTLVVFLDKV